MFSDQWLVVIIVPLGRHLASPSFGLRPSFSSHSVVIRLFTAHCPLSTVYWTLGFAVIKGLRPSFSSHSVVIRLFTAHCPLLTVHCPLITDHCYTKLYGGQGPVYRTENPSMTSIFSNSAPNFLLPPSVSKQDRFKSMCMFSLSVFLVFSTQRSSA